MPRHRQMYTRPPRPSGEQEFLCIAWPPTPLWAQAFPISILRWISRMSGTAGVEMDRAARLLSPLQEGPPNLTKALARLDAQSPRGGRLVPSTESDTTQL